jgi:hypothetical protein
MIFLIVIAVIGVGATRIAIDEMDEDVRDYQQYDPKTLKSFLCLVIFLLPPPYFPKEWRAVIIWYG